MIKQSNNVTVDRFIPTVSNWALAYYRQHVIMTAHSIALLKYLTPNVFICMHYAQEDVDASQHLYKRLKNLKFKPGYHLLSIEPFAFKSLTLDLTVYWIKSWSWVGPCTARAATMELLKMMLNSKVSFQSCIFVLSSSLLWWNFYFKAWIVNRSLNQLLSVKI